MADACRVVPTLQRIENGRPDGRIIVLRDEEVVVGRKEECQIWIPDHLVSRRHARIFRKDGRHFVEDLGSRNKTFVDGVGLEKRSPVSLADQAVLKFSEFPYLFRTHAIRVEDSESISSTILGVRPPAPDAAAEGPSSAPIADADAMISAVVAFSKTLGNSLDLDASFERALDAILRVFPQADCGFILLRGEGGSDELIPKAIRNRRGGYLGDPTGPVPSISQTILRHTLRERKAILSSDAIKDPLFAAAHSVQGSQIRTVICAPILERDGQALGVVQLDTRVAHGQFGPRDLDLLSAFAGQIGVAMEVVHLHEIVSRRREVEQDIKNARDVQRALLPEDDPDVPGYRFWNYYQPAQYVGGDYFDYIPLDRPSGPPEDARWAALIGDVAGHGMAAALMMAKLSSDARMAVLTEDRPARMMERINDRLVEAARAERYVTLLLLALDPGRHRATLVNAAHPPPILRRANGSVERPGAGRTGMLLGYEKGQDYAETAVDLSPGDLIVLYTDGVYEALDERGTHFGQARLAEAVARVAQHADPETVGNEILRALTRFVGQAPQNDDIAILCIQRSPESTADPDS